MEKLLNNLNVKNTRIEAIDGKNEKLGHYLKRTYLSNYEIACVLSHIKAINYLSKIDGDYFLVCEDDIDFFNTQYFTISLEKIIKDAPNDFDILQIGKTQNNSFQKNNLYEKYNKTWGAYAYIISRKGINNLQKISHYDSTTNQFTINNELKVTELFIFNNLNTYTYKYNFINTLNSDSNIHSEHLVWHKKCSLIGLYDILINLDYI
jgi:GR25 family glycosyltransferase involved in LPS biosynthesis